MMISNYQSALVTGTPYSESLSNPNMPTTDVSYKFELPTHHKPIIKVIGVGGGGSNAVNNMYRRGIKDVSFIVCNTDIQALQGSPIQQKLQIGASLTGGLGAGANPEMGKNAAIESKEAIKEILDDDTKMLFITAGMGGGTGTGSVPIIASIAKKKGILTVGIVTLPFSFEGKTKLLQAQEGIQQLRQHCDTVLVILNDRLQSTLGRLSMSNAFLQADDVLTTAAKSIAEIITVPGYINVDFEDVKTVMQNAGAAVMGSGQAEGEHRALKAAELALASPLLDYQEILGARKILLSIVSGQEAELCMDELTVITDYIQQQTGNDAEVIFGHSTDPQLLENIRVTVIATGFDKKVIPLTSSSVEGVAEKKMSLMEKQGFLFEQEMEISPRIESLKKQVSADNGSLHLHNKKKNKQQFSCDITTASSNNIVSDAKYIQELIDVPAYVRKSVQLLSIAQLPQDELIRHALYVMEDNKSL